MRTRTLRLATFPLILACVLALNAKRPMTASMDVAPNPVLPGDALAVTSSLTNNTSDVQVFAVSTQMRGPCGVTASKGYKVLLNGHQTDTSKASFQAPACPGGYQATLTVSDNDGAVLGTASASFAVIARATSGGSK